MEEQVGVVSNVQKPCTFFKKTSRKNTSGRLRKRQQKQDISSDEDESDDEESAVVRREKKLVKTNLFHSTSSSKIKHTKPDIDEMENKDDSDNDSRQEEEKMRLRSLFSYESKKTNEREGPSDLGATATLETETQQDRDTRALFEKARKMNKELKGKKEDNIYRGNKNYTKYVEAKDSAQMNAANKKGPIRAPTFLRATTRWDYQPDICKDYKETGYCGFGDSCKFLHDRSDYKSGWQLEREWQENQYGKEEITEYEIHSNKDDDLPFACFICRQNFKVPVVTKCRHYFCESCALEYYRKTSMRCAVCGQPTSGVFNPAKEISIKQKEMEEMKKRSKELELIPE